MKYTLGITALILILGLFPLQGIAEEHEPPQLPSECPLPLGCDWRTTITIVVKDGNGVENWAIEWTGPAMGYIDNVKHNYLLLGHIFARDPGATEPGGMRFIDELVQ